MNKAEIHYLNCTDENCERFACVARRDFNRKIEYKDDALAKRDKEAKHFCRLYNEALDTIVKLKKDLGDDPGDY